MKHARRPRLGRRSESIKCRSSGINSTRQVPLKHIERILSTTRLGPISRAGNITLVLTLCQVSINVVAAPALHASLQSRKGKLGLPARIFTLATTEILARRRRQLGLQWMQRRRIRETALVGPDDRASSAGGGGGWDRMYGRVFINCDAVRVARPAFAVD